MRANILLFVTQATSPYLSGVPGVGSTYAQYYAPQLVPAMLGHDHAAAASPLGVMQQPMLQQKLPRTDRLEVRTRSFKFTFVNIRVEASRCCLILRGRITVSWSTYFLLNFYSSNIKLKKKLIWQPLIWRCRRSRTPYLAKETPVTPDPCFAWAHWPGELARVLREQHSLTMVKDLHYWRNHLAIGLDRKKIVVLYCGLIAWWHCAHGVLAPLAYNSR